MSFYKRVVEFETEVLQAVVSLHTVRVEFEAWIQLDERRDVDYGRKIDSKESKFILQIIVECD